MKIAKAISLLAVAAVVVACGGGGDEAGDAAEMSVIPEDVTFKVGACSSNRLFVGETVHTINGGTPPFRINASDPGLFEFGIYQIVNNTRQFVPLPLRGDGFVELRGKDPQFVVRTLLGAGCVDPSVITVLDSFSTAVPIEYVIEEEEEDAAAPE